MRTRKIFSNSGRANSHQGFYPIHIRRNFPLRVRAYDNQRDAVSSCCAKEQNKKDGDRNTVAREKKRVKSDELR